MLLKSQQNTKALKPPWRRKIYRLLLYSPGKEHTHQVLAFCLQLFPKLSFSAIPSESCFGPLLFCYLHKLALLGGFPCKAWCLPPLDYGSEGIAGPTGHFGGHRWWQLSPHFNKNLLRAHVCPGPYGVNKAVALVFREGGRKYTNGKMCNCTVCSYNWMMCN